MQLTAVAWLVWRLEHSAFLLGLVGFASRIPTFVFAPIAGVWVDRMNRYHLVILTQVLSMIQALLFAALMYSGHIQVWHIVALSLLLGCINTLDIPARQSFLIQLLNRKEDLVNAIALNSSMVNGARLIGPSIAGFLVAGFGEAVCFLLNGLSYVAVIGGLLMMRVTPNKKVPRHTAILKNLMEGFHYAFGFPPIRALLLLLAVVSLTGAAYTQLLPIFAEIILHGDARTQGALISATAIGALAGALYLAGRRTVRGLGRVVAWSPVIFGVGLIGMGLSSVLWLTMLIMPMVGLGLMVQLAATNTLLQTIVDDDKRGRVMSFYSMAFMGMVPLGSLIAGTMAHYVGAPMTVIIGGICCIIGAYSFARVLPKLKAHIHPIYVKKGIIVEVATGLQSATRINP